MSLIELAERVEAATGPDRELDDAVATALFDDPHRACIKGLSDEAGGMWMFRYPNGSIGSSLRFTGSLDAAMTLVPRWLTPTIIGHDREVRLLNGIGLTGGGDDHCSHASTLPLALCAAALRARAAIAKARGQ